jgi:hypothetical protein
VFILKCRITYELFPLGTLLFVFSNSHSVLSHMLRIFCFYIKMTLKFLNVLIYYFYLGYQSDRFEFLFLNLKENHLSYQQGRFVVQNCKNGRKSHFIFSDVSYYNTFVSHHLILQVFYTFLHMWANTL